MLKTSSVVPSPDRQKARIAPRAHGSLRLCDQGMAEWSNNGDPDDYPPRWSSRALCKAGRVGVLDQVHNAPHPAPEGAFRAEPRTNRVGVFGRGIRAIEASRVPDGQPP